MTAQANNQTTPRRMPVVAGIVGPGRYVEISLTSFVDVVSKAGTPKATCVKTIKGQLAAGYDPATDFYKILRENIAEIHAQGKPKSALAVIPGLVYDPKRTAKYPGLVAAYGSWWGRKNITWFLPPRSVWVPSGSGIGIRVNPELGLEFGGERHVVKLYFKDDKLTKPRVDIITHLLDQEFGTAHPGTHFSVLDVPRKKLYTVTPPSMLGAALTAEVAYIDALWDHV